MFKGLSGDALIKALYCKNSIEVVEFINRFNYDLDEVCKIAHEAGENDSLNLNSDQWIIYDNLYDESAKFDTWANGIINTLKAEETFSYDIENRNELLPAYYIIQNYLEWLSNKQVEAVCQIGDLANEISKELPKGDFMLWSKSTPNWHNGRKRLFTLAVNDKLQAKINKFYKLVRANLSTLVEIEPYLDFSLDEYNFSTVFEFNNFKIYIIDRYTDEVRNHQNKNKSQSSMQLAFNNASVN